MGKIKQFFRKFVKGCKWFAFSWHTHYFAPIYTDETLAWLLKNHGKEFIRRGKCDGAELIGHEMMKVSDRLYKLTSDDFGASIREAYDKKFPDKPFIIDDPLHPDYHAYGMWLNTKRGLKYCIGIGNVNKKIKEAENKERLEIYTYIAKNLHLWSD